MTAILNIARRILRRPSLPRQLSSAGFQTIDSAQLVEEETFSWYNPTHFYPVQIGQVFNSNYQVLGKLGYGGYSTIWLCRDLLKHRYVTLKVCTRNAPAVKREVEIFKHLNTLTTANVGGKFVRTMLDQFEVDNTHGTYQCIVHKPMCTSLARFRRLYPGNRLPELVLKVALSHILSALDFLHTEAKVIHTDIQEKNILLELDDDSSLKDFEKEEQTNPSPRKIDGDRIIYTSRDVVPKNYGRPILCDFGEARFGQSTYTDNIQPYQYRAPEVILDVPWNEKVDIWNVGVMIWDLFEDDNMFETRGGPKNERSTLYHLAHMVALLGPPPKDFLQRSITDAPWKYFDSEGHWKGATEIPIESFETSEENLEGENKARFLQFVRKMLKWKPEERNSAKQLLEDPWLNDGYKLLK